MPEDWFADAWKYMGKYWKTVVHTYTWPVLWMAAAWVVSLPIRLALGRPLLRAALPLVFVTGQLKAKALFRGTRFKQG